MKTLHFEDVHKNESYLNIQRIEQHPDAANARTFEPHSHDYYVIMILSHGTGVHTIDFREQPYKEKSLFFLGPNQLHQVKESTPNKGFVITFSPDFLLKSNISRNFIDNINLFRTFSDAPPLTPPDPVFTKILGFAKAMENCIRRNTPFKFQALGAYLKLLLIECNTVCELNGTEVSQMMDNAVLTIRSFKELVEVHYREWHKVGDFAEALNISSNYLNKLVNTYLNTSPKEYIQNRIILEVKRRLATSDLSAKEIAYEMGYREPAHLSNAFKSCTGMSITAFRERLMT